MAEKERFNQIPQKCIYLDFSCSFSVNYQIPLNYSIIQQHWDLNGCFEEVVHLSLTNFVVPSEVKILKGGNSLCLEFQ